MAQVLELQQLPIEVREKAQIVVDKMALLTAFFVDLGYRPLVGRHELDNVLHFPQTTFRYTTASREVGVTFLYFDGYKNDLNYVSLSIIRLPHSKKGDFISMDVYLQKKGIHIIREDLMASSYPGIYEEKVTALFSKVKELLHEHALGILKGTEWREDSYTPW